MFSEDDKKYINEELERMRTYARFRNPALGDMIYQGEIYPKFQRYNVKLYHNKDKRKKR